jgi:GNAT superfamily N-acetyltransferase
MMVDPLRNPLLASGPWQAWLAVAESPREDGMICRRAIRPQPLGRLLAGISNRLNRAGAPRVTGYLTMFESRPDPRVGGALLGTALGWLRDMGAHAVRGPISPTDGDAYRGLLVEGFDHLPAFRESYNPPCYAGMFEAAGFTRATDYLSRRSALGQVPARSAAVDQAMERFGYRTYPFDRGQAARESRDIHRVLLDSFGSDWHDIPTPSVEEVVSVVRELRRYARPELARIARRSNGEPIGFALALPDFNQAIRHLRGNPPGLGWVRAWAGLRRIDTVRLMLLFVRPPYRRQGVSAALYRDILSESLRLGFRWGIGSSYDEGNAAIAREANSLGGEAYARFRVYGREL